MSSLPKNAAPVPRFVSLESPSKSLDGLTASSELKAFGEAVCKQWTSTDKLAELANYGIYPIRQVLFYGPPGNGKTTACQWLGKRLEMPVYRVKSEAITGAYLGATQGNVGELLAWLKTIGPAIVLFDEIESLFPSREAGQDSCARELQSAMTVLWQALDRWTTPQIFIFATNMQERLDKAFVSRMEASLEFGPPTPEQISAVVAYWCEIFHEYGAADWGPRLSVQGFISFRELWQAISNCVRASALA